MDQVSEQKSILKMTLSSNGNIVRYADVMASISIDRRELYLDFKEH